MTDGMFGAARPVPDTIVLIHGLWMTPRCWEGWIERYAAKGFKVIAPAWPGMEAEVEALRADPSPIAGLTIERIVAHYEERILDLEQPPIIMGHSYGGTFTQILLDRGLGASGVGVASATVKGVKDLPVSSIRAAFPALDPRNHAGAVPLTAEQFHYAFTNTLEPAASKAIYDRYQVPGAVGVLKEGAFANFHREAATTVDFRREDRAPLLLIGFGEDHLVPPSAIRHNEEKYDGSVSVVEYKEFPGRPHFPSVPGWEEVADYALDWATTHVR